MKILQTLTLLLASYFTAFSQSKDFKEQVFISVNTSFAISGEDLLFTVFNRSQKTGEASKLSGIVYLELVGKNGSVLQKKVKLVQGLASGALFIPSVIESGHYNLIAYTRWMKNFDDLVAIPITIVNPFEEPAERSNIQAKAEGDVSIKFQTLSGCVTAKQVNQVFFTIEANNPAQVSGRIVSQEGETYANIEPNQYGIGSFLIEPSEEKPLRVVLEDANGNFHFSEFLSATMECPIIKITENSQSFSLSLENTPNELGKIIITNGLGKVGEKNISILGNTVILKSELAKGYQNLHIQNSAGETISSFSVFNNSTIGPIIENMKPAYEKLSLVELMVELPAGSYTISVGKEWRHDKNTVIDPTLNRLNFQAHGSSSIPENMSLSEQNLALWSSGPLDFTPLPKEVGLRPETELELLSGKLTDASGNAVKGERVTFTLVEEPFSFQSTTTDSSGLFTMAFESPSKNIDAFLSTMTAREDIVFTRDDKWWGDDLDFNFKDLILDSSVVSEVVSRSKKVQLYRAYEKQKEAVENNGYPEFEQWDNYFLFDDYTRFPTLRDHFVEYISMAAVRKGNIKPFFQYNLPEGEYPKLLLLDGVPVKDEKLLEFNPFKIKSVGLINTRFYKGSLIADGVVSLETFDGGMSDYDAASSVQKVEVLALENSNFSAINGSLFSEDDDRIPDFRHQLYFNSVLLAETQILKLNFNTSEIAGDFSITIFGFTKDGEEIFTRKTFIVSEEQQP